MSVRREGGRGRRAPRSLATAYADLCGAAVRYVLTKEKSRGGRRGMAQEKEKEKERVCER